MNFCSAMTKQGSMHELVQFSSVQPFLEPLLFLHLTLRNSCNNHQLLHGSFLCTQNAWLLLHAPCMTEANYISVQLRSYPVYLSLWSLCQHLQNNVQIFLEFWTNTQCNVSKYRENLRFHWPMNCAILKNKDTKLYLSPNILFYKLHNLNILTSATELVTKLIQVNLAAFSANNF